MGSWNDVLREIQSDSASPFDRVRRKYLIQLHEYTKRNIIIYYSGWLQKPSREYGYVCSINDDDKNGFMACFYGIDVNLGLDLLLHSPGGDVAATESIIHYIRSKFGHNVRIIVPQISMSGGTMLACMGKEIVMGRQSNIGPIDPQISGVPAIAVLKEFEQAYNEIQADNTKIAVWRPILEKYPPTYLSQCDHAIKWSKQIGIDAVQHGMFNGEADAESKAEKVIEQLISHEVHLAHGRHLHREDCKKIGLRIVDLEGDQRFQDAVLTLHHAVMITMANTPAAKIIENHAGIGSIRQVSPIAFQPMSVG